METTIREFLAGIENGERITTGKSTGIYTLDKPCKVRFSVDKTGSLFHRCGGDVVLCFDFIDTTLRPVVLVRDTFEAEKWDREKLENSGKISSPRPNAVLKLKQTA